MNVTNIEWIFIERGKGKTFPLSLFQYIVNSFNLISYNQKTTESHHSDRVKIRIVKMSPKYPESTDPKTSFNKYTKIQITRSCL
ncbi:unnamed protein product [Callosobruchus maculatus]|uniref:Uncharacterized protein n=1 Tax=Callosobruchus maculatus TaxID=64391 RepID=A0A653C6R0_CALMS|nr:unnamed protein product [Callosobruchus maculatus]